jgi:hypothetical protein
MSVQIDETWGDQFALRVDRTFGKRRIDRRLDGSNLSVANADVTNAAEPLAGVNDIAAANDEIELLRRVAK